MAHMCDPARVNSTKCWLAAGREAQRWLPRLWREGASRRDLRGALGKRRVDGASAVRAQGPFSPRALSVQRWTLDVRHGVWMGERGLATEGTPG